MKEKTKGKILGAAFIVLMACVAGFVIAQTPGDSPQQTQPATAGDAGLASEEASTGGECVDCPGFQDTDGDGACDKSGECPYKEQAGGFADADGDGACDNAANCPMHQNKGGCHGSEGCPRMKEGFMGGCRRIASSE